jgi:hypothetical protein
MMEKSTVVSSVFGKQLPNIQASSLLRMDDCTCAMVFSTAGLVKRRFASGVRTTGKSFSAASDSDGVSANVEAANEVLQMNWRRVITFSFENVINGIKNPSAVLRWIFQLICRIANSHVA